jgi:hypothetical protein
VRASAAQCLQPFCKTGCRAGSIGKREMRGRMARQQSILRVKGES